MQLAMRKFDVKKNYFITKDLVGVDFKNFNTILLQVYNFKSQLF